jgi:hypothetical protein
LVDLNTTNEYFLCITLADNFVFPYNNANDMRVTQDLNSFGEIMAHAHCSVDEKKIKNIFRVYHIRIIAKKIGKLIMHVSSRNMFPTRNLQIGVHVYRPRYCCGD